MQCGEQRTVPSPERTSEFSRRQVRVTVAFSRTHRGWQARGAGGVSKPSLCRLSSAHLWCWNDIVLERVGLLESAV